MIRLATVAKFIQNHDATCLIIGIDGPGGAGKTTTAAKLAQLIDTNDIVHLDDYLVDKEKNNTPDLLGYDRVKLRKELAAKKTGYTIVEGISALHPDFRDSLDIAIWLSTDPALAMQRAKVRDNHKHDSLWPMWMENHHRYLKTHAPHQLADYIVNIDNL